MRKRGQVSMFVILGIVILIVISLAFFFRSQIADKISQMEIVKSEQARQMESDLQSYASSCLKKTAAEGVQSVLSNGGYYGRQGGTVSYNAFSVPYYLDDDKEDVPKVTDIAVGLARHIDDNIGACLSAYSQNIQLGEPSSEVKMGSMVAAEVRQSLVLSSGETSVKVSSYSAEVEFDISKVYKPTMEFYNEVKNISSVDFLGQGYMALEGNYKFYVDEVSERESVFVLFYPSAFGAKNIEWMFAIRYPEAKEQGINPLELFA